MDSAPVTPRSASHSGDKKKKKKKVRRGLGTGHVGSVECHLHIAYSIRTYLSLCVSVVTFPSSPHTCASVTPRSTSLSGDRKKKVRRGPGHVGVGV